MCIKTSCIIKAHKDNMWTYSTLSIHLSQVKGRFRGLDRYYACVLSRRKQLRTVTI